MNQGYPCNEFIIKNGKFIRDFEGMYQYFDDPWQQREKHGSDLLNNSALNYLSGIIKKERIMINKILDIGCAEGYYASKLLALSHNKKCIYVGIDISPTVIRRAKCSFLESQTKFVMDDIRVFNKNFYSQYDLVFSAKTLYYVAPEIDQALQNIELYLSERGVFCFTYNQRHDAFSNRWLTYEILRKKVLTRVFIERLFVEINRLSSEKLAIGIYQRADITSK